MSRARFTVAVVLLMLPTLLFAQKKNKNGQGNDDPTARATVLHVANLYVMADGSSPPIATVTPGHEVAIMGRNGAWVNVFANTDEHENVDPDNEPEFKDPNATTHQFSGWIHDQGVVGPTTPNGDAILYGAAAELEGQARQPHAPKDAAEEAHLLYKRVVDYFPDSPLAPEAAFRAADIRWQLNKLDNSSLPSAHEQQAYLRPQIYEGDLKRVMKMYPDSPFAARAAYDLIDNKLCGDWQGLPKCPEMETQTVPEVCGSLSGWAEVGGGDVSGGVPAGRAGDDVHGGRRQEERRQGRAELPGDRRPDEAEVSEVRLCGAGGEHCVPREAGDSDLRHRP